jgi:Tfp pilus assembly protein PilN
MTTLTPTRLAAMPRVNLLPPEIAAAAKLKRLKAMLALVVLAVMVVVALAYLVVTSQVGSAEEDLSAAQAEGATLQAEKATYSEVPEVYAAVDTAQQNLATAMTPEIRWSFYLNDLSLTIPRSTRLSSMTAVNDAADAQLNGVVATTEGATLTALGETKMGSISFTGRSEDFDAVASWLQSLARQNGYLEPYVQSVVKGESEGAKGTWFVVESNTQLSPEAASMRFEQIANGE